MLKRLVLIMHTMAILIAANTQSIRHRFTHLTTEEGLADNTVNDILQDKKGFMWFATNNGLQRYDGNKFRNYRFDFSNKNSLPSDNVFKLMEDDQENIWIACNTGVAMIDPVRQKIKRVNMEVEGGDVPIEIWQLFQDRRKNKWLISTTNGIFLFDTKAQKFIAINKRIRGFNWRTHLMVEEPKTGNFWLGCDSGLAYFDAKAHAVYNYKNNPLHISLLEQPNLYHVTISALAIDASNNFWMNTVWTDYPKSTEMHYSAYKYNSQEKSLSPYQSPVNASHTYSIDHEKNIWIYGQNVLAVKHGNNFATVDYLSKEMPGLKTDMISCLTEDRQHNKWIGTDNGVFLYNPEEAKIKRGFAFTSAEKQVEVTIKSFLELPNKKIWVGTKGYGILEYSFDFKPLKQYDFGTNDLSYSSVWSLYKARNGKIWVGCQAGRIMIYDSATQKFEKLIADAFGLRTIRTITEDQQSNIWFGTQYGTIVKYDAALKQFIRYADYSKEAVGNINHLMVDRNNILWACTTGLGLLKINVSNGKVIEQYLHSSTDLSTLSGNLVRRILEYNDSLMIVSATGINIFNTKTKKFSYITTADELPSNSVAGLLKDASGNIWAGLNGGLVKVSWPSKKIEIFGTGDGIVNTVFQQDAMQLLSDGRLVAGTTKDFIYFHPRQFKSNKPPPDIKITSFRVFQHELNIDSILMQDDKVRLSSDQNFIAIDFSALTYLNNKLYYYYKLEGVDKNWIKTNDLTATYTYLNGGNYTFMVRSENGDGVTSRNITTLKIYIRPAFYVTWWFFFLLAAAIGGMLYYFYRGRVNRILDMQKVRGRIARDLHDDMGSTLSTINILSEMAKFKIDKDTAVTKDYITKISDNSHRMMEAMDDIVWSINPMNDSMQKITARMREYATSLLEAKDIEYTFHVDEAIKRIKLDMEARRDFFLIFKEAVNNLVKYSQCKHANIKIETYDYTMVMKIQDDGIGFKVADADSGNGLTNMKKRAQSLNSKFSIESKPGLGTKITLEVIFA